jgi:glycosyltransferase involved in cell wall biosynthesis
MLNEFSKINNHNIKLIICGACTDPELLTKIQLYITNSNITFINKHINNNDIQIFMNASDTVILPFNKINSSGSAILALSFAKTIIAPQKGTLNEMPKNVGYFYSNGNNNGLYKSMINSISKRNMLEIIGQNGYEYIKTFSWNNISKKTLRLYKELEQKD